MSGYIAGDLRGAQKLHRSLGDDDLFLRVKRTGDNFASWIDDDAVPSDFERQRAEPLLDSIRPYETCGADHITRRLGRECPRKKVLARPEGLGRLRGGTFVSRPASDMKLSSLRDQGIAGQHHLMLPAIEAAKPSTEPSPSPQATRSSMVG